MGTSAKKATGCAAYVSLLSLAASAALGDAIGTQVLSRDRYVTG